MATTTNTVIILIIRKEYALIILLFLLSFPFLNKTSAVEDRTLSYVLSKVKDQYLSNIPDTVDKVILFLSM